MFALNSNRGRYAAIGIAISTVALVVATSVGSAGLANAQVATSTLAGCQVLPQNNVWNAPIDTLPLDSKSLTYVTTIGASTALHPDFGAFYWEGAPTGIPYVVVPGTQPKVPVTFDYTDESDAGPYPIPTSAPIEGGPSSAGDRHVLVLDQATCLLYETWSSYPQANGSWHAGSGAIFDLKSNALRPSTWTSADAAGLPILPGLLRYDEVASGAINHAIRFTAPQTRAAFVWPARHIASSLTGSQYPPMGQRFRLKASFDISLYPADVQVILVALKKYGMILADNGSSWYVSGAPDSRWNDDHLNQLKQLHGADFEAVDESGLMVDPNSGQAKQPGGSPTTTPTPSASPTAKPSATATPRPSATSTPTARPSATATPRPSATSTPTSRPSATSTPRPSATATRTPRPRWHRANPAPWPTVLAPIGQIQRDPDGIS